MHQGLAFVRIVYALFVYYTYYGLDRVFHSITAVGIRFPRKTAAVIGAAARNITKHVAANLQGYMSLAILIVFLVSILVHSVSPEKNISQSAPLIFALLFAIFMPLVIGYMCLLTLPNFWPKAEVGLYTEKWIPEKGSLPEGYTLFRLKQNKEDMYKPILTVREVRTQVYLEHGIGSDDCLMENEVTELLTFCKRHGFYEEIVFNKKVAEVVRYNGHSEKQTLSMVVFLQYGSRGNFYVGHLNLDEAHRGRNTYFLVYKRKESIIA